MRAGDDSRDRPFRLDDVLVRPDRNEIETPEGETRRVEPKSMAVLLVLAERAGDTVSRKELLATVWGGDAVTENVLSRCIWDLRRILGEDARRPRFIHTVPRNGYRLAVSPQPVGAPSPADEERPSIAVLPFLDLSPGHDQEYLADGLVEELIHALTRISRLRVVSRTSAFEFKGASRDVREIGGRLGVDLVLEGSLRAADDRLRILARLVLVEDGIDLWAETFERQRGDFIEVQRAIASAIVRRLHASLPEGAEASGPLPPDRSPEAQNEYLRGRFFANRRSAAGLSRALAHFRRCCELEPEDARALAGLADVHLLQAIYGYAAPAEVVPPARQAAEAALLRDAALAEALTSLGLAQAIWDWAWGESERAFLAAIDADPEYATAHQWLAMNVLVPRRRFGEAGRRLEWAAGLDPLAPTLQLSLGIARYYAGRPADALGPLEAAAELDPVFVPPRLFLGLTAVAAGRIGAGIDALGRALELSDGGDEPLSALGYARGVAGDGEGARAALGELEARAAERYLSPVLRAQVLAGLGETDATLDALAEALEVRASDACWIGVRPAFEGLRGEARFAELCERMGLPAG